MGRKKILLVDDSSTVILLEKMLFSRCPYDLVVAKDGQEGLEKATLEQPDLILLDVMMPRMTGLEVCRRLRTRGMRTPIILVTTRGQDQSVNAGFAAGCSDYITKPIDGGELLAKVRDHLGA